MEDNKKVLDIDAIMAELDEEFSFEDEDETTTTEEETGSEDQDETVDENEESTETVEEDEDSTDEEEQEDSTQTDNFQITEEEHKRNRAFQQLREERDSLADSDAFLEKLASQYGMSKTQLMENFTEQATQKAAEEAGIEPEQFKRMQELEQRVTQAEEAQMREVFNMKAGAFAERYSLDDKGLSAVFAEGYNLGLDVTQNPDLLEMIYRSMNYDAAKEVGKQEYLAKTKKRQSTSVGKTGTQGAQVNTTEQDWDDEIDAFLQGKI